MHRTMPADDNDETPNDEPVDEPADEKDDDDADEEETNVFKIKRKKSAGERIRELTTARHEAEREADRLRRENEELKSSKKVEEPEASKPSADLEKDAPNPDEQLDGGAPKYPLGEFDPKYIRDLTRYTIKVEREAAKAEETKSAEEAHYKEAEQALQTSWSDKLAAVDPEIKEGLRATAVDLENTFRDLHPDYGKYLASTIMSMDHGPQVLHYLASHLGEARKIVASGPTAATIALGRIEARFDVDVEKVKKVRETKAPPPPPTNRGSGGKFSVAPDTDDLDAFEKAFFKKK
jgi:hypothetical protein